jgi:hypothetical protein
MNQGNVPSIFSYLYLGNRLPQIRKPPGTPGIRCFVQGAIYSFRYEKNRKKPREAEFLIDFREIIRET